MEQFLVDPEVGPLPPMPNCQVDACIRTADGSCGYCNIHYQRFRNALRADPELDTRRWQTRESGVSDPGQVNLRALPALVVVEILFGVQQRVRGGAKIRDGSLRVLCDGLRWREVSSITADRAEIARNKVVTTLRSAFTEHIRRALSDPESEQAKDTWDLAVFVHRGNLAFTGIGQPWLSQCAKRWAAEQLPHHRSLGATRVRTKINGLLMLSQFLGCRPDRGLIPSTLGRSDIETFLNRLAHLESIGEISRYRRTSICRNLREVLTGIRVLGLTRAGQPAAGLAGDFSLERGDIPSDPEPGEPGRDIPPEIMAILCANLDTLEPAEVRAAIQIGIDTGRRPEDILALPLNCLVRDKDGAAVLVYDNAKADRLGRRLPIAETTADVIITQRQRVRSMFPDTPAAELVLLPTQRCNPYGRKPISIDMLDERHREWVSALPVLRTRDGIEIDKTKVVPYIYRHCYAQRHADAGVPIDVLAELLDHRSYAVTRRYYRIGEDRRRAAVDTVTALSFDRHGNRIWREARTLVESERARHAVGEVAVPYGTRTEPTNVKAGGGACPVRYRCVGCDHFRTNIAYLPELQTYLDDLLRTRERLAATLNAVDDWARVDATPTEEEITLVRRLIGRIKGDIAVLDDTERANIDDALPPSAVTALPTQCLSACPYSPSLHPPHRPHPLRRTPHDRQTRHNPPTRNAAQNARTRTMLNGRREDSLRRRQRVLAALDQARTDGHQISASTIARAAGVDRTFLYRHRDLLEKIRAQQTDPGRHEHTSSTVTRASLQAGLLAAHEKGRAAQHPHPPTREAAVRGAR
jgi:integrase